MVIAVNDANEILLKIGQALSNAAGVGQAGVHVRIRVVCLLHRDWQAVACPAEALKTREKVVAEVSASTVRVMCQANCSRRLMRAVTSRDRNGTHKRTGRESYKFAWLSTFVILRRKSTKHIPCQVRLGQFLCRLTGERYRPTCLLFGSCILQLVLERSRVLRCRVWSLEFTVAKQGLPATDKLISDRAES